MANLKVDVYEPIRDGMEVKFRTPCDCSAVTGLTVYSQDEETGEWVTNGFKLTDAHGVDIGSLGNLFASGVLVKVMLDTTNRKAYILNADTNSYLEEKIASAGSETSKGTLTIDLSDGAVTQLTGSYWRKQGEIVMCWAAGKVTGLSEATLISFTLKGAPVDGTQPTCVVGSYGNVSPNPKGSTFMYANGGVRCSFSFDEGMISDGDSFYFEIHAICSSVPLNG